MHEPEITRPKAKGFFVYVDVDDYDLTRGGAEDFDSLPEALAAYLDAAAHGTNARLVAYVDYGEPEITLVQTGNFGPFNY